MPSGPLDDHDAEDPIAIPYTALSADALQGVIESFVLREGTDYGEREFSLQQKIAHVMAQLHSGEAQIWFDPESQSLHIARSKRGVGAIGS